MSGPLRDHVVLLQPPTLAAPELPVADVVNAMRYDKSIRWIVLIEAGRITGVVAPETLFALTRDADLLAKWQLTDGGVALANPLSAELGVMRTRLLPGLVAALARGYAGRARVRLRRRRALAALDGAALLRPRSRGPAAACSECIRRILW